MPTRTEKYSALRDLVAVAIIDQRNPPLTWQEAQAASTRVLALFGVDLSTSALDRPDTLPKMDTLLSESTKNTARRAATAAARLRSASSG